MDSSLSHSSFKTLTSPLTSSVTRCHLTESKSSTQLVLLVYSNSWALEIIHSLDLSEELIMVSTEFLRSAPSPPISSPQLLQVSSSSEMELMQETASLSMLLKAILGLLTSWSQSITLMSPYLKTGVIWWHPTPSFPKCPSTLETCPSKVFPITISTEDMKPTQNGHSGVNSVPETHAISQTSGMDHTSTPLPKDVLKLARLFGMFGALKIQTKHPSMILSKRLVRSSLLPSSLHPCMEIPNFSSDTSDSKKISKPAPTGDPMFKCSKNQPLLRTSHFLSRLPLNAHSTTYLAWCEEKWNVKHVL